MNYYFVNITNAVNLKSSKNCNSNDVIELISQFNDHGSIKNKSKLSANNPWYIYI